MRIVALFCITMITLFILDFIWINYFAIDLYMESIGSLLRQGPDGLAPILHAAIIVYICISLGIILFVLPRANKSYLQALIWGALFGAITYGIYDFTNYSILANWPYGITIVDVLWGTFLCGLTSMIVVFFQNRLYRDKTLMGRN